MKKWLLEHWGSVGLVAIASITWAVECWDAFATTPNPQAFLSRAVALACLGVYVVQDLRFWIQEARFEWTVSRAGQGAQQVQDEPEAAVVPFVEEKPAYRVNGHKVDAVDFFEGEASGDDWHTRDAA